MSKLRGKERPPKRVLALPDPEQSKAAVLNSLTSKSGQRMGQWNDAKSAVGDCPGSRLASRDREACSA